jgi:hypothetical protein
MHPRHRAEDILLVDPQLALELELMGKDVEQDLGIRRGVEVAKIFDEEVALEILGIREVAVVGKHDAVGRIDVEGLSLGRAGRAGGGVTDMADTHVAAQLDHVARTEDIPRKTVVLAQMELVALTGDDTSGILSPVLEHEQRIVERLVDRTFTDDADDAAHDFLARAQPRRPRRMLLNGNSGLYPARLTRDNSEPPLRRSAGPRRMRLPMLAATTSRPTGWRAAASDCWLDAGSRRPVAGGWRPGKTQTPQDLKTLDPCLHLFRHEADQPIGDGLELADKS